MSYEDVIRVAEAKIDPARFRRIEGEIGAKDQPYVITEFLKPGIEELCQVLPPRLARAIVAYSDKRGWLGTVYFGMELKTTTVWGYLRFLGRSRSCIGGAREAGAITKSKSQSKPGSRASSRRRSFRLTWRSKSPSAHA